MSRTGGRGTKWSAGTRVPEWTARMTKTVGEPGLEVVRPLTLTRRRSRRRWVYLLYHRPPRLQGSTRGPAIGRPIRSGSAVLATEERGNVEAGRQISILVACAGAHAGGSADAADRDGQLEQRLPDDRYAVR